MSEPDRLYRSSPALSGAIAPFSSIRGAIASPSIRFPAAPSCWPSSIRRRSPGRTPPADAGRPTGGWSRAAKPPFSPSSPDRITARSASKRDFLDPVSVGRREPRPRLRRCPSLGHPRSDAAGRRGRAVGRSRPGAGQLDRGGAAGSGLRRLPPAPILTLADVLEPDLCRHLVDASSAAAAGKAASCRTSRARRSSISTTAGNAGAISV